jgi:hypothetical protein
MFSMVWKRLQDYGHHLHVQKVRGALPARP